MSQRAGAAFVDAVRNDGLPASAALSDPRFLAALVALVLNDRVLKVQFGNWFTGKLSDLAGLIVLPVIVTLILRALGVKRAAEASFGGVATWFILMKTVPDVARATETLVEAIIRSSSTIIVDPTDLLGFAGLVVARSILIAPRPAVTNRAALRGIGALALIACTATSQAPPPRLDLVVESGQVAVLTELDGDGYDRSACLSAERSGDCFRLVGGRVERQVENGARWTLDYVVHDEPFLREMVDPVGWAARFDALDIAAPGDGTVHVAFDGLGVATRSANGAWSPTFQDLRPITTLMLLIGVGLGSIVLSAAAGRRLYAAVAYGGVVLGSALMTIGAGRASVVSDNLFFFGGMIVTLAVLVALLGLGGRTELDHAVNVSRLLVGSVALIVGLILVLIWKHRLTATPSWAFAGYIVAASGCVVVFAIPDAPEDR